MNNGHKRGSLLSSFAECSAELPLSKTRAARPRSSFYGLSFGAAHYSAAGRAAPPLSCLVAATRHQYTSPMTTRQTANNRPSQFRLGAFFSLRPWRQQWPRALRRPSPPANRSTSFPFFALHFFPAPAREEVNLAGPIRHIPHGTLARASKEKREQATNTSGPLNQTNAPTRTHTRSWTLAEAVANLMLYNRSSST